VKVHQFLIDDQEYEDAAMIIPRVFVFTQSLETRFDSEDSVFRSELKRKLILLSIGNGFTYQAAMS